MATIKIEIETGNAAFEDSPEFEVSRILRELAFRLSPDGMGVSLGYVNGNKLYDINGQPVGTITVKS